MIMLKKQKKLWNLKIFSKIELKERERAKKILENVHAFWYYTAGQKLILKPMAKNCYLCIIVKQ